MDLVYLCNFMIILNLKTYPQSTLNNGSVNLAKIAQEVYNKYQIPIILAPQTTDIYKVSQAVNLSVYAQHIDAITPGKHTGYISATAVKESGATGVLINHSEHRLLKNGQLDIKLLEQTLNIAKENNLKTLVCVENVAEAKQIGHLEIDAIALEDPTLIGGNESIVANNAGKQQVTNFVNLKLASLPLVGAGVKHRIDIQTSLELGAKGVLLASGFVKASDPKEFLSDLCEGYK